MLLKLGTDTETVTVTVHFLRTADLPLTQLIDCPLCEQPTFLLKFCA